MIVNISNSIPIKSFVPHWESGIDWRSIGGEWKPLDRGIETQKYSSTITILGTEAEVVVIRDIVITAQKAGTTLTLKFADYEKVFGSEFGYGSAFICYVGEGDSPITSDTDTAGLVTYSFEAFPDGDMSVYYAYSPTSLPSGLMIQKIERTKNPSNRLKENEASVLGLGLGNEAPQTEITYIARTSVSGEAIAYLKTLRGGSFSMVMSLGLWIFEYGTYSEDVCVIDVQSNGMLDKASLYESFVVTYGKGVSNIDPTKFIDVDGKVYDLVDINGTIWFKQNYSRDTANSWVYQDNPTKEADFGRLYTYAQAVANCPSGFHLPTLTEFIALENFLGGNVNAGYHLKSTLPEWTNPGDDLVGFFARPSSYRQNTNSSYGAGNQSYYWTSTTQPGNLIIVFYTEIGNSLTNSEYDQTTFSFSVRYVKD